MIYTQKHGEINPRFKNTGIIFNDKVLKELNDQEHI